MRICVISDTHARVLHELRALNEIKAVCGNMDSNEIRRLLPAKDLFDAPDTIIFGHSHQSENVIIDKTLMLNPGPAHSSFAWLEMNTEVRVEIVKLQA